MNLPDFLKTWHGAQDENRFQRRSNLILLAINALLVMALLAKSHTVIIDPPGLAARGEIGSGSANPEVRRAWGQFYATLLGNVTPANASELATLLEPGLTPQIYHQVSQALAAQIKQVNDDKITTRFLPKQTYVSDKTGHVFVVGDLVTEGLRGVSERETRTYEFGFIVSNYQVLLDDMRIHKGEVTPKIAEKTS